MARVLVLVFAVVMLGAGAYIASVFLNPSQPFLTPLAAPLLDIVSPPIEPVAPGDLAAETFTVRLGATAIQIGEELKSRNLIRSAAGFREVVDRKGVGAKLAAGDYDLSRSMSTEQIVDVLASGKVKRGLLATIPEGWRAEQIAEKLEAGGLTGRDEFLAAVATPASIPSVASLGSPPPPTLEGYLFPWTYEVKERVTGVQAVDLMIKTFDERVGDQLRRGATERGLTVHQLVTLASIVEREAVQPAERPMIASVFLNRLDEGMMLQADPTVQYAIASRDGRTASGYGYWRELLVPDLTIDSPYNTYARVGLPPGPICDPGEASIRAVVEPAKTDFLYFVAKGDGAHVFARTLDEHNENVAKYASS